MLGVRCRTCVYWSPNPRPSANAGRFRDDGDVPSGERGQCRRYPPFMGPAGDGKTKTMWPMTGEYHWCGEHPDAVRRAHDPAARP